MTRSNPREGRRQPLQVLIVAPVAVIAAALWAHQAGSATGADDPGVGRVEPVRAMVPTTSRPESPAGEPVLGGPEPGIHGRVPASLLLFPPRAEAVLMVDLERNEMHVMRRGEKGARHARNLYVSIGKQGIRKLREGDEKTPVGIYLVSSFIPGSYLPAIYGDGAFPLDYPNAWDRRHDRGGSGIWIHGTDKSDESLLPQSSRGCLTLRNRDFQALAEDVQVRLTPVIVSDRLRWVSAEEVAARRGELAAAVESWRSDWEALDTEAYLGHYSTDFRTDGMDLRAFAEHKRRVNAGKSFIRLELDNLGMFAYPDEEDLVLVTFQQRYASSNFESQRRKHQYWRREAAGWRIVQEDSV